ncbi:MAG: FkbM family methyltransferase [Deltaproteobacteria bacterium]|nr:FkbM family methyltransferase [Deltaproteobacteria bacterium]
MTTLRIQWTSTMVSPAFRNRPLQTLRRLAVWKLICLFKRPVRVKFNPWDLVMILPAEWKGTAKLLYAFREAYEPELVVLEQFLKPGETMVDVGANYGVYSLRASKLVGPRGRVFAFEPASKAFRYLQRNMRENSLENVSAFSLALSNQAGKAHLYLNQDPSRNSIASDLEGSDFEEIETNTLDAILADQGISRLHFLKIDAEGADELVCQGARKTLAAYHPVVMFEVNPEAAGLLGLQKENIGVLLTNLGYRFYKVCPTGKLQQVDKLPAGGNVIAIYQDGDQECVS